MKSAEIIRSSALLLERWEREVEVYIADIEKAEPHLADMEIRIDFGQPNAEWLAMRISLEGYSCKVKYTLCGHGASRRLLAYALEIRFEAKEVANG